MEKCSINGLVKELQKYKVYNSTHHDGDLYEHSVWTAKCIERWLQEKNVWVKDIKLSKKIIILSGLMHDFGKVGINPKYGDEKQNYNYIAKPNHENEGFDIMTGKKTIEIIENVDKFKKIVNKENLRKYFKKYCNVNDLEYSIIAITGGMHYELGNIMKNIDKEKRNMRKSDCLTYILKFLIMIKDKNLPYKFRLKKEYALSINILRLCLAISAADNMGAKPIINKNNKLYKSMYDILNFDKIKKPIPKKKDNPYYKYEYNTKGLRLTNSIINIYQNNKSVFV